MNLTKTDKATLVGLYIAKFDKGALTRLDSPVCGMLLMFSGTHWDPALHL